jgi:hypothetical protein
VTDHYAKLKLDGAYGPMVAAPEYPLEAVLRKLGIPYRVLTREDFNKPMVSTGPIEVCPMEVPEGIDEWLAFSYGSSRGR